MRLFENIQTFFEKVFFRVRFPLGISVDITNRCNLRCKHCYFLRQEQKSELSDDQLLAKIHELRRRHPHLLHAGWVGGEPLLRIPLLAECVRLFPMNMIVTNGTIALPVLPKSVFNVSVDGTRAIYEAIRGARVYDTVKDHANRNDVRVNIACVINRMNRECIEALVEEWRKTKIRGISFSFYTPAWKEDNGLNLSGAERDAVIDRLLVLKKDHGDFIINSRSVLVLMKSASSSAITTRCLAQKVFLSVDATGTPKLPCVLGAQADCARCGCVVPFEIESVINRRHFDSLRTVKKFYAG